MALDKTEFYEAHNYFLLPLTDLREMPEDPEDLKEEDVLFVGGVGIIKELANFIDDDDVVMEFGISGVRCILALDLSKERCIKLIEKVHKAFDKKYETSVQY